MACYAVKCFVLSVQLILNEKTTWSSVKLSNDDVVSSSPIICNIVRNEKHKKIWINEMPGRRLKHAKSLEKRDGLEQSVS